MFSWQHLHLSRKYYINALRTFKWLTAWFLGVYLYSQTRHMHSSWIATKRSQFALLLDREWRRTKVHQREKGSHKANNNNDEEFSRKNPENIKLFALILEFALHSVADHWELMCVCISYFRTKMDTMHNFNINIHWKSFLMAHWIGKKLKVQKRRVR